MLFDFLSPLLPFAISVTMMMAALYIPALNRNGKALGIYMAVVLAVSAVGSFVWI